MGSSIPSTTRRSWLTLGLALCLIGPSGCLESQGDGVGATAPEAAQRGLESKVPQPASGLCQRFGSSRLPPYLLQIRDDEEIRQTIDQCLTVSAAEAEAFALGYAAKAKRMNGPLAVCARLPVEDSLGRLMAYQVILSAGEEDCVGIAALDTIATTLAEQEQPSPSRAGFSKASARPTESKGSDSDSARFIKINSLSHDDFFTINVSAYFFRHPVATAHRGLPRWLALSHQVAAVCRVPAPQAVLPASGLPKAVELVRYRCGDGTTFLHSHYSDSRFHPSEVKTRHLPERAFLRWSDNIRRKYPDPEARLSFIEELWTSHIAAAKRGGQP